MNIVPISLAFGIWAGIHSFSLDSEIIALRASGVSLSFLFKPILALATVAAIVTGACTLYLSPMGVTALEEFKFQLLEQQSKVNIIPGQINKFGNQLIYIIEKDKKKMRGVFITNWKTPEKEVTIEAKRGILQLDPKTKRLVFHLEDGRLHLPSKGDESKLINFKEFDYNFALPQSDRSRLGKRFQTGNRSRTDMSYTVTELNNILKQPKLKEKDIYEYSAELHARFVMILACIPLAIFALGLGITNPRVPKKTGLLFMILILILYFSAHTQFFVRADRGQASPYILYVTPFITLIFSLINFYRINYDYDTLNEMFRFAFFKKDSVEHDDEDIVST